MENESFLLVWSFPLHAQDRYLCVELPAALLENSGNGLLFMTIFDLGILTAAIFFYYCDSTAKTS